MLRHVHAVPGESFDIHTGGVDNIFPHHTNEMAQSEGATGRPFARYWLHAEHLLVDGAKMSKSLGNYYTIPDLLDLGYRPSAIRYLLLGAHYRTQLNFTLDGLAKADRSLERLTEFRRRLGSIRPSAAASGPSTEPSSTGGVKADSPVIALAREAREGFIAAMDDDLSVSEALGVVFTLVREVNRELDGRADRLGPEESGAVLSVLTDFDTVFGVLELRAAEDAETDPSLREWVEERIAAREAARAARDWARADAIRNEVEERGILLEDTPEGTRWKVGGAASSQPSSAD